MLCTGVLELNILPTYRRLPELDRGAQRNISFKIKWGEYFKFTHFLAANGCG